MLSVGLKRAVTFSTILLVLLSSFTAEAQVLETAWVTTHGASGREQVSGQIEQLLSRTLASTESGSIDQLRTLFNKTHKRFLRHYVQYAGLEEIGDGRYDCLTATTLFADILTRAGFRFEVIETNYHIFITVETTAGKVVLETTDRFGGFISDPRRIEDILSSYRKNNLAASSAHELRFSFGLWQSISTENLASLLYFNQAVKAFNSKQWLECSNKLALSAATRPSPRVWELATALCQVVSNSEVEKEVRDSILVRWEQPIARR